jgi:outer membrane protein insertion porin family
MTKQLAQKLLLVMALFISAVSYSQTTGDIPIGNSKEYIIGDITVTGAKSYNQNTVVAFTGLRKGEKIFVPGERLSSVVKKLWELKLFSDIRVYATGIKGDPNDDIIDTINLEFNIIEVPTLNAIEIEGIGKARQKDLLKELNLTKGAKANENLVTTTRNFIEKKYKDKGFLNADALVRVREVKDTLGNNLVDMKIEIDKGEKVKIDEIRFVGNEQLSEKKLHKAMKNTKQRNFFNVLKRSKYVEEKYQEDLKSIVNAYKENGFRDARILSDTLTVIDDKDIALKIKVEEGDKYYFGDIKFIGNTAYTDQQLQRILKVEKGDVYNGVAFDNQISDPSDPDAREFKTTL